MAAPLLLLVHAGEHDRNMCPVSTDLPGTYTNNSTFALRDVETGKPIPCQAAQTKSGIALTWLVDGLKAGGTQKLEVVGSDEPSAEPVVRVVDHRQVGRVDVTIARKRFTSYHYGRQWVRPFLHPVIGPLGAQVTRNWPIVAGVEGEMNDHSHHKSIWVAYGECDEADNWSEELGHGYQRHREFLELVSGQAFGRIVAKNDWCTAEDHKQFEEVRDMRFYAVAGGVRLVDLSVSFRMTEKTVVFHDTKEGGLVSVRVASSMDVVRGGRIENGYGGINEDETWGKDAPWCDYSGKVNGKRVGIALLDHETNPRYPTGWHVRNYGLMTANCFAWSHYRPDANIKGDMEFREGSTTTWRYRIYVHKGDARQGRVAERFIDFIAPPKVTIG